MAAAGGSFGARLTLPPTSLAPLPLCLSSAAVGRLQAVSRRLCMELDNERDLQSKIKALLQKSE